MKNTIKIFFVLFALFSATTANAEIVRDVAIPKQKEISVTSYPDYYPFGYRLFDGKKAVDGSVFQDVLASVIPESEPELYYVYYDTLTQAVLDIKAGKTEVYLGAFYGTSVFEDFDFVFPAVLNNPVYLMMPQSKIRQVRNLDDLKKLRGIYVQKEMFSDHVLNMFKDFGLTAVKSTDAAYEQLLTGEADFMFGSYYYQYIQVLEKGLKNYISFSSKPIWNMPMFVAISKRLPNRAIMHEYLRKKVSSPSFKEKVLSHLKTLIEEKEKQTVGTVPPTYIKEGAKNDLTPADMPTKTEEK